MKKLFLFFITYFSYSTLALEGMITVLEAPLLLLPDLDSTVLQTKRRGAVLHLHRGSLNKELNGTDYYMTLTTDGQDAYIHKKYIKVIHKDSTELKEGMITLASDPTDYRLSEPLPNNYPLDDPQDLRAGFNLVYGSGNKENYSYNQNIERESFNYQMGASLWYAKKVDFDKTNRFYFGFQGEVISQVSEFILTDNTFTRESQTRFTFGPTLRYDVYRDYNYKVVFNGGLKASYHRHLVAFDGDFGQEERIFSGYSFGANMGSAIHFKNLLPSNIYELVLGAEVNSFLPYSLQSSTPIELTRYWNEENDSVNYDLNLNASVFIGIIGNY